MNKIIITIFSLTFILHPSSVLSQISIEDYTSGSFFSYAQDRITTYGNPLVLRGENEKMENLYLDNGRQSGDTLYYKFYDDNTSRTTLYNFILKKFKYDSIILIPLSQPAKVFYNYRKEIRFYNRKYFFDTSFSFVKLYYFSGQDPSHYANGMALKIDSSRNVLLKFESAFDSTESGNYVGIMTEDGYTQLIKFLQSDNVRTLVWPKSKYYGQDPQTLILYYNKHRKELVANGDTPYITSNMILLFHQIRKFSILEKTNKELSFEEQQ